jgi:hypothetical protein
VAVGEEVRRLDGFRARSMRSASIPESCAKSYKTRRPTPRRTERLGPGRCSVADARARRLPASRGRARVIPSPPARPLAQPAGDIVAGVSESWALVSTCWLIRAIALFLLLGSFGVGFSFPRASAQRSSRGVANRSGWRGHTGRRERRGSDRLGRRLPGAQRRCLGWRPRRLLRGAILLFAVAWRSALSLVPTRAPPERPTSCRQHSPRRV